GGRTSPVAGIKSANTSRSVSVRKGRSLNLSASSRVIEVEQPTTVEEVRKRVDDLGIDFIFAQFVDLHARPSAKLVPAQHLEDLFQDGAGFAGLAAGDIGQNPSSPD